MRRAPQTLQDWLYTSSVFFAEATNGEVFRDDLGEFTKIRNEILHGMPEDVRAKKSARVRSKRHSRDSIITLVA